MFMWSLHPTLISSFRVLHEQGSPHENRMEINTILLNAKLESNVSSIHYPIHCSNGKQTRTGALSVMTVWYQTGDCKCQ